MKASCHSARSAHGFSLVEALLTIAIMGILTSLVVGVVSNASMDSSRMVARQQQVAVQSAVEAWVNGQMRNPATGQVVSQESIRATYNSVSTPLARLNLVGPNYLDSATFNYLVTSTTNSSAISSDALNLIGQHLDLPQWNAGSYPQVNLVSN